MKEEVKNLKIRGIFEKPREGNAHQRRGGEGGEQAKSSCLAHQRETKQRKMKMADELRFTKVDRNLHDGTRGER